MMEILYKRVIYLCKKYDVTNYAIEKATHLSDGSIKRWEKSPPSCDRLMRVAQYFGVSVDFLLGLTDNPKSQLNKELLDRVAKDLRNRVEKWQNQIVESKESLYSDIDQKLTLYGLKSTSNIDIDAEEIINDPDLPR